MTQYYTENDGKTYLVDTEAGTRVLVSGVPDTAVYAGGVAHTEQSALVHHGVTKPAPAVGGGGDTNGVETGGNGTVSVSVAEGQPIFGPFDWAIPEIVEGLFNWFNGASSNPLPDVPGLGNTSTWLKWGVIGAVGITILGGAKELKGLLR